MTRGKAALAALLLIGVTIAAAPASAQVYPTCPPGYYFAPNYALCFPAGYFYDPGYYDNQGYYPYYPYTPGFGYAPFFFFGGRFGGFHHHFGHGFEGRGHFGRGFEGHGGGHFSRR
jgi:hypothetical protein